MKIRTKVFETNSSSSHSFSAEKKLNLDYEVVIPNEDGVIVIEKDFYGREVKSYNEFYRKASYIASGMHIPVDWKKSKENNYDEWRVIENIILEYTGASEVVLIEDGWHSGIDHESYDNHLKFLKSAPSLKDALFSPECWIFTSNDEGGGRWVIGDNNEPELEEDDYSWM